MRCSSIALAPLVCMGEDGRHNAAIDVNHCLIEVEVLGAPRSVTPKTTRCRSLRCRCGSMGCVLKILLASSRWWASAPWPKICKAVCKRSTLVLEGCLRMNTIRADGIDSGRVHLSRAPGVAALLGPSPGTGRLPPRLPQPRHRPAAAPAAQPPPGNTTTDLPDDEIPFEQGSRLIARWLDPAVDRVRAREQRGRGGVRATGPAGATANAGPAAADSLIRLAWSRRRSWALVFAIIFALTGR